LRWIKAPELLPPETGATSPFWSNAMPTAHYHAVVWLDHHEARIVYFNADDTDEKVVHPAHPPRHLHHTAGSPAGTHDRGDPT
jgi:hypothetical protein